MKLTSLHDLYVEELRDLYSAETQIVKALPKMAKAATHEELRTAFEEHLEQSKEHVERLEQIFESLDESPKGKKCKGLQGLVEEAEELMGEDMTPNVLDAGLIAAAQRVEHYEIAVYGTLCTFAELLGRGEDHDLLGQTLEEEKEADSRLTEVAESAINADAEEVEKEASE